MRSYAVKILSIRPTPDDAAHEGLVDHRDRAEAPHLHHRRQMAKVRRAGGHDFLGQTSCANARCAVELPGGRWARTGEETPVPPRGNPRVGGWIGEEGAPASHSWNERMSAVTCAIRRRVAASRGRTTRRCDAARDIWRAARCRSGSPRSPPHLFARERRTTDRRGNPRGCIRSSVLAATQGPRARDRKVISACLRPPHRYVRDTGQRAANAATGHQSVCSARRRGGKQRVRGFVE